MTDRHRPAVPTVPPPASGAAAGGLSVRACAATPARVVGRVDLPTADRTLGVGCDAWDAEVRVAWDPRRAVLILARAHDAALEIPGAELGGLLGALAVAHGAALAAVTRHS